MNHSNDVWYRYYGVYSIWLNITDGRWLYTAEGNGETIKSTDLDELIQKIEQRRDRA